MLMSLKINNSINGINSINSLNAPEMDISDNTEILEDVAEDAAYDTYESSKKEDENTAIPCENYNDLLQTMKYAKVEQMSETNTEDDSAYEESRKERTNQ